MNLLRTLLSKYVFIAFDLRLEFVNERNIYLKDLMKQVYPSGKLKFQYLQLQEIVKRPNFLLQACRSVFSLNSIR